MLWNAEGSGLFDTIPVAMEILVAQTPSVCRPFPPSRSGCISEILHGPREGFNVCRKVLTSFERSDSLDFHCLLPRLRTARDCRSRERVVDVVHDRARLAGMIFCHHTQLIAWKLQDERLWGLCCCWRCRPLHQRPNSLVLQSPNVGLRAGIFAGSCVMLACTIDNSSQAHFHCNTELWP